MKANKLLTLFLAGFACCFSNPVNAQNSSDSTTVLMLLRKAEGYRFMKPDSFLPVAQKALAFARQIDFKKGIGQSLNAIGEFERVSGNYPEALEHFTQALAIGDEAGERLIKAQATGFMGITYTALGEYQKGVKYLKQAIPITIEIKFDAGSAFFLSNIGDAYEKMGLNDSALFFHRWAWGIGKNITMKPGQAYVLGKMGVLQAKLKNYDSAFHYFNLALEKSNTDVLNYARLHHYMAEVYAALHNEDSVRKYGRLAIQDGNISNQRSIILEVADILYKSFHKTGPQDSAYKYLQLNARLRDSLFGREKFRKLQMLAIREQENKHLAEKKEQELRSQIENSQIRSRSRYRTIALSATVLFIGLIAFLVWRNLKRQKKLNFTLSSQQEKISAQNVELGKTLKDLRATQSQLIQSEKMASLGELTAGIAHEIQNPLNFVNNFSELNRELIEEMNTQLDKGNMQSSKQLAENILENEAKITHHGKRADAIVKSMLQHSRISAGKKELTDINNLVDEYLRLAYHGLRAKDPTFNAKIETDFDPALGKIELLPQDIGRVLINLINNALYEVNQKKKNAAEGFDPLVKVSTSKLSNAAEIRIRDNGNGIPDLVVEKIFQPFFTTKPTGQGTGLGLSLSYDIIKAQGGEIKVDSKQGEYAEFTIELPV